MKLWKECGPSGDSGDTFAILPTTLADLKAALAEHGMVAVPVEPTEEMMQAGFDEDEDGMDAVAIYKAMIKAAEEGND